MAKKPNPKPEMVLFDVVYEDGSQLSNRRVPGALLTELEHEALIKSFLEDQDREIGVRSGRPRAAIKTFSRSR